MKKKQIEAEAKNTLEYLTPHQRYKNQVVAIQGNDGFTIAICDTETSAEIIVRVLNAHRNALLDKSKGA